MSGLQVFSFFFFFYFYFLFFLEPWSIWEVNANTGMRMKVCEGALGGYLGRYSAMPVSASAER
jgi:hypothetical protein